MIRIRQDASLTTAEPAIAVAHDQIMDRIACGVDQPTCDVWSLNEVELSERCTERHVVVGN
jgi:hypothetical protein